MLKKDIKEYNKNFFDEINNKWAILVSGNRNIGINGMTVSWGSIGVLWNKPMFIVYVRKSRYTYDFCEKSDSFTLSFLGDKYKKEKALFGSKSGRNLDKFKETNLHPTYDPDFDGYYVAEASYVFKCKKIHSMDIEYDNLPDDIKKKSYPDRDIHKMYIAEIKQYLVNEE